MISIQSWQPSFCGYCFHKNFLKCYGQWVNFHTKHCQCLPHGVLVAAKTLTLGDQLCQILLQTWYWTIFITYNLMKYVGDMSLKNQHCLNQQNLCLYFYMGDKLHKTIFRIIYLGSHKSLQTEHPHRSFHFLCHSGSLFHTVQRSERNTFSDHQL